jgi:hypothetical protein
MLVPFSTHRPRCGSAGSSRGCNGYNRACNGYNCACNGYNRACNADGSTAFVHAGHTAVSCWTRSSTRRARRGRASGRRRWRSTRVRSAVCDRSATAEQILLVLPRVPSTILSTMNSCVALRCRVCVGCHSGRCVAAQARMHVSDAFGEAVFFLSYCCSCWLPLYCCAYPGMPVTLIGEAVFARCLSAMKVGSVVRRPSVLR